MLYRRISENQGTYSCFFSRKYHQQTGVLASIKCTSCLFISFVQEADKAFVLKQQRWSACKGSQGHYRGYPCSLWTLFHALTVNAEQLGESKYMLCTWCNSYWSTTCTREASSCNYYAQFKIHYCRPGTIWVVIKLLPPCTLFYLA